MPVNNLLTAHGQDIDDPEEGIVLSLPVLATNNPSPVQLAVQQHCRTMSRYFCPCTLSSIARTISERLRTVLLSSASSSCPVRNLNENAKAEAVAMTVESFLLFSQSIPSQNLGFVDSRAARLDLTVADRDLSIVQSPTILSSNRGGGTTGAGELRITLSCSFSSRLVLSYLGLILFSRLSPSPLIYINQKISSLRSRLEDYTPVRFLAGLAIQRPLQARCFEKFFHSPRAGLRHLWDHRLIRGAADRIVRLDGSGLCDEAATREPPRESGRCWWCCLVLLDDQGSEEHVAAKEGISSRGEIQYHHPAAGLGDG